MSFPPADKPLWQRHVEKTFCHPIHIFQRGDYQPQLVTGLPLSSLGCVNTSEVTSSSHRTNGNVSDYSPVCVTFAIDIIFGFFSFPVPSATDKNVLPLGKVKSVCSCRYSIVFHSLCFSLLYLHVYLVKNPCAHGPYIMFILFVSYYYIYI